MSTPTTASTRRSAPLLFLFLFAMVCGIVGVAFRLYNGPETVQKPAPQPIMIPVASSDLKQGRRIKGSDYYVLPMSAADFAKVAKGKVVFTQAKDLVGRIVKGEVKLGAPFSVDSVYPEGTGPTPAELLTEGMRAATVRVSLVGGIRGFASPDTWVDVLFRRSDTGLKPSTDSARTHTLLAGVRILAIQDNTVANSFLSGDRNSKPTEEFELTLELTPEQAEVLKSVEQRGDLSLNMLPQDSDRRNMGTLPSPEVMKLMLGVEDPTPEPPVVVVTPPPSVRIIRGGSPSSVTVEHQADLIMDRSLYPAPVRNPDPPVDPPAPPASPDPSRVWPQYRPVEVRTQPVDDNAAPQSAPAVDESKPSAAPSQPQRRTGVSDSSIIVQGPVRRAPPARTLVPRLTSTTPTRLPQSRPQVPTASLYQSSYRPSPRLSPLRRTNISRPSSLAPLTTAHRSHYTSSGSSRTGRSVVSAVSSVNRGRLPLLASGPRRPLNTLPATTPRVSSPVYAADPRRPLVLSSPPSPAPTRVAAATPRRPDWPTSRPTELVLSNTLLTRSSRLPLLKSGAQN
ncbi:MAG: Flp pilus assembly protein CpaB [Planctomycetaceae bacterium]